MNEETKNEEIKTEQSTDTVSRLFDDRDRDGGDRNSHEQPGKEESRNEETPALQKAEKIKINHTPEAKPPEKINDGKEDEDNHQPSEAEVLRKKLDKVEKNLVENHKYGRSNAQKVKNALKVVQRFADEGTLAEEEARELLGTLHLEEEHPDERNTPTHQASPFAPIFKVANQELQNILKYTDDEHLQDKVNAFDYFLSVGSKEEIDHVLEDLTDLMDNPLKLARKMLAIGERVYQESYRGIKEAGGFKNYLATKDQEIEKLHKKLDKLEKKLLQYEDFDHPRYRMDEMGDVEGSKPANDTISDLFDERDKVKRR